VNTYIILSAYDEDTLEGEINQAVAQGYKTDGNLVVAVLQTPNNLNRVRLYQKMVRAC
jgi:hypothetical protein